jgi:hypothetical protein
MLMENKLVYCDKNSEFSQTKVSNYFSLDEYVYNSTKKWLNSIFEKEYYNSEEGVITPNMVVSALQKSGAPWKTLFRMEHCHTKSCYFSCRECHALKVVPASCNNKLCPLCSRIRKRRILGKYGSIIRKMKNPKLITFTSLPLIVFYPDVVSKFKSDAYAVVKKFFKQPIPNGFSVIEFGNKTMMLHAHFVVDDPRYVPQFKLSEAWHKRTGAIVVDIRRCTPKMAMGYVLKYVIKPPVFDNTDKFVYYYQITLGRRRFSTYGKLFSIDEGEKKRMGVLFCSHCGSDAGFDFRYELSAIDDPYINAELLKVGVVIP